MIRGRAVAVLLLLAAAASGCKKSESVSAGQGREGKPGAEAPPPTPAPSGEPKFTDTAVAGPTPFAGMKVSHDLAVDDRGRIWATDFGNFRIRVFDPAGASFGGWGTSGTGPYGVKEPSSIAIWKENVYVCDMWNGRIQHFSLEGTYKGTAAGLYGPGGVAAGPGRVAVSDSGHNQVVLYDADLKDERHLGKAGSEAGDFHGPVGIAIGPSGNLYVADVGNRRIQVLAPDGRPKAAWPVPGWANWCLAYLDVDADDTVYATDCSGESVWVFNRTGKLVRSITVADDGTKFFGPLGVALDRKNRILYVAHSIAPPILKVKLGK